MKSTRFVVVAVAIACSLTTANHAVAENKRPLADDSIVKPFVEYLAKNGIKLEHKESNIWVVTDPKAEGYVVIVYFRTFAADATVQAIEEEIKTINLAFMFNANARLAMSHPGLQGKDIKKLPNLKDVPEVAKLTKLFKEYSPPEPKK
jgi:hypothetical protein